MHQWRIWRLGNCKCCFVDKPAPVYILSTHGFLFNNRHVQHCITNHTAHWQVDRAPAPLCARDKMNFQIGYIPLLCKTSLGQQSQASEVKDE